MGLKIYKRGQGKYTRLGSAFAAAIIIGLGCLQLYKKLQAVDWKLSQKATLWVATMVPAGLFALFALLIYWLVNKPTVADFLVASEGEIKKVSWSSRREITVSTFIVIVVVAIMAALLGVADLGFQMFFDKLLR